MGLRPCALGGARRQPFAATHGIERAFPLLVEGKDLKLDREVDLAQRDVVGNLQHRWCEVKDALHARRDEPVGCVLRRASGRGDDPDRDLALFHDALEVREVLNDHRVDGLADLRLVDVDQRAHAEPALAEAAIVRQRAPEVADADDDAVPILREPELTADLINEVLDVVADAARAVRTEVREVFPDLRRVDPGGFGKPFARDRLHPALGHVHEASQVQREPRDGRFRDGAFSHELSPTGFTKILGACERNHKRHQGRESAARRACDAAHRARAPRLSRRPAPRRTRLHRARSPARESRIADRIRPPRSRCPTRRAARARPHTDGTRAPCRTRRDGSSVRPHQVGESPGSSTRCRGAREASKKPTNITPTPIASVTENAAPFAYRTKAVLPIATIVTPIAMRRFARTRSFGGATPLRRREDSAAIPTTTTYAIVEYQIASDRTE